MKRSGKACFVVFMEWKRVFQGSDRFQWYLRDLRGFQQVSMTFYRVLLKIMIIYQNFGFFEICVIFEIVFKNCCKNLTKKLIKFFFSRLTPRFMCFKAKHRGLFIIWYRGWTWCGLCQCNPSLAESSICSSILPILLISNANLFQKQKCFLLLI